MHIANIYEAKTHLSQLIEQAVHGEDIIIAKSGKPLVKLVPYQANQKRRHPGCWRGKVKIAKDFDELPKSILDAFKGEKE